ncbi:MAG: DUF359 domain-containing protein [Candidatus Bilamarchaeaceae archaeon]
MLRSILSSKRVLYLPDYLRKQLKKPLGRLQRLSPRIAAAGRKIVCIGDQTTLNLLDLGVRPHLAVCDFRIKRKTIRKKERDRIIRAFKLVGRYSNPPGTLSKSLLKDAKILLRKGGLLRIQGEEDLTALAFITAGSKQYLVLYGQPDKGVVVIKPENKKIRKKIERILTSAFCHKIQRSCR